MKHETLLLQEKLCKPRAGDATFKQAKSDNLSRHMMISTAGNTSTLTSRRTRWELPLGRTGNDQQRLIVSQQRPRIPTEELDPAAILSLCSRNQWTETS